MPTFATLAVFALTAYQSRAGAIRDRPLTWDWMGVVPLEAAQKPSQDQLGMFDAMRRGDYYVADAPTRNHFTKHPGDLVDAWILIQCARYRGKVSEILADSARWVAANPTAATRFLRVRALNLAYIVRKRNDTTHDPMNALRREIKEAEASLYPYAAKNIAALTAVLGSLDSDIKGGRDLARAYSESKPNSIEASILNVRSLLRGTFGNVAATADAYGRMVPAPRLPRMQLLLPTEPRMDDALAELTRIEKKLGKHPLVDYYRSQAYAMKAYFSDPKKGNEAKLEAAAVAAAQRFLEEGDDYPRLAGCAREYLETRRFFAFLPWPDE